MLASFPPRQAPPDPACSVFADPDTYVLHLQVAPAPTTAPGSGFANAHGHGQQQQQLQQKQVVLGKYEGEPEDMRAPRWARLPPGRRVAFRARAAAVAGASPLAGGVRAMYRGVVPTTVRGIVLSATQICSYDQIKQSLKRRGVMQEGVPLHLTASMFAGCVGPCRSLGCVWRLMVGRL